jgi:ankyrin repeat protein
VVLAGAQDYIVQSLRSALTTQVFNASFNGNLRVLEGVFSLPAALLQATGVHGGMQQAGSLLQPLHMASYNGHLNVARFLLARPRVSVQARAGDHDTALHKACYNAHSLVVKLLLDAGADPNALTPFTVDNGGAAQRGPRRNGRRTPLHYTVFNHELPPSDSRTECVRALLSKGGDANLRDCWGLTPLHHAAYGGFVEIARVLHRHGPCNLNLQCGDDEAGDTPLMKACWKGHVAIVALLLCDRPSLGIDDLDYPGADPNVANRAGATALHFAADKGFMEIVEMLLAAGGKALPDKKNHLPHDIAQSKGHVRIAALLGSQLDAPQNSSVAPLPPPAAASPDQPASDTAAGPPPGRPGETRQLHSV